MAKTKRIVSDIHPPEECLQWFTILKQRLGTVNFEERISVEKKVNPNASYSFRKSGKIFIHKSAKALISAYLGMTGKYQQAIQNCWKTEIVNNSIQLPKSSLKQPIRILHLSDLHLDTDLSQADKWAELIATQHYDIAVITGDFFNGFKIPNKTELQALEKVIAQIKQPIFGILGNHDALLVTPPLEQMGITMLLNESFPTTIHGQKVLITGLDESHFFKSADFEQALQTVPPHFEAELRILLIHAPDLVEEASNHGFDIQLSGHTHGGQLCTSKRTPILRNGNFKEERLSGAWSHQQLAGYTSRGTGTGRLCFRLNCPPEITIHEIV